MLVAVDAGNTRIKFASVEADRITARTELASQPAPSVKRIVQTLADLTRGRGGDHAPEPRIAVCSVVPRLSDVLRSAISRYLPGAAITWISAECDIGLALALAQPHTLGADRLANAVAAADAFGGPVIAVGCGTATTLTVVNARLELVGGAIAPGPELQARTLAEGTGLLPFVSLPATAWPTIDAIGDDTVKAIRSGVVYGAAGGIDRLIHQAREELEANAPVVLTGGYAPTLSPLIRLKHTVDTDLTMKGIRIIADRDLRRP